MKKRWQKVFVGWSEKSLEDFLFINYSCHVTKRKYKWPLEIRLEQTKKRVLEKSSEAFKVRITIEEL